MHLKLYANMSQNICTIFIVELLYNYLDLGVVWSEFILKLFLNMHALLSLRNAPTLSAITLSLSLSLSLHLMQVTNGASNSSTHIFVHLNENDLNLISSG